MMEMKSCVFTPWPSFYLTAQWIHPCKWQQSSLPAEGHDGASVDFLGCQFSAGKHNGCVVLAKETCVLITLIFCYMYVCIYLSIATFLSSTFCNEITVVCMSYFRWCHCSLLGPNTASFILRQFWSFHYNVGYWRKKRNSHRAART